MSTLEEVLAQLKAQLKIIEKREDTKLEAKQIGKKAPAGKLKAASNWAPESVLALWRVMNGVIFEWRFVDEPAELGSLHLVELGVEPKSAADFGFPEGSVLLVDASLPEGEVYYLAEKGTSFDDAYLIFATSGEERDHSALGYDLAEYLTRGLACGFMNYWQVDQEKRQVAQERLAVPALNFGKVLPGQRCKIKKADRLVQTRGMVRELKQAPSGVPHGFVELDHGECFWCPTAAMMPVKAKDLYEWLLASPNERFAELDELEPAALAIWWGRIGGNTGSSSGYSEPFEFETRELSPRYAGLLRQLPLEARVQYVVRWCERWIEIDPSLDTEGGFEPDGSEYFAKDYGLGRFTWKAIATNLVDGLTLSILGDYIRGGDSGLAELVSPETRDGLTRLVGVEMLKPQGLAALLAAPNVPSLDGSSLWLHYRGEDEVLDEVWGVWVG